ncbi:ribosome-associated heat shock protein Hsp15 [Pseudohalioglobus sediminis]|uniref:Heat shock protein 15 n=1 Tax=Pseudohalioglobus sediminis TaxID=2606449 RepID=A0A5B0WPW3_9GAMM|nr:ribosome-associated heat shock protein Hsp15 [Pseudohalioglobus sediminis]KAA1188826.1 ribosome-associated heat shock protein Hsp15 [Pseudohalioglobus sediminis]
MTEHTLDKLRLDKWLWAARFFKTRSLAKAAIEGGKVHLGGQRVKVSREISVGDTLQIRQGWDEKVVVVEALSDQRRGAPEAASLYRETAESLARREADAAARKAAGGMIDRPASRPTKKQRRQIHRFKEGS